MAILVADEAIMACSLEAVSALLTPFSVLRPTTTRLQKDLAELANCKLPDHPKELLRQLVNAVLRVRRFLATARKIRKFRNFFIASLGFSFYFSDDVLNTTIWIGFSSSVSTYVKYTYLVSVIGQDLLPYHRL